MRAKTNITMLDRLNGIFRDLKP